MGGHGSGRLNGQAAKWRVEECVVFDLDRYLRAGFLDHNRPTVLEQTWDVNRPWYGRPGIATPEDVHAVIGFDPAKKRILFAHDHLQDLSHHTIPSIRLSQSQLPWGASRWWMHCPHASYAPEGYCGKRVRKLYLAPTSRYLGCRSCHELTYNSRATSRAWDSVARQCFPNGSVCGTTVKHIMERGAKERQICEDNYEKRELRKRRRRAIGWS